MTAPDPRPYAAPTDLITAEDVARWLDTLHQGPPAERIFGVQDAIVALDARLDRERRQACERGAEDCERRARALCPDGDYTRGPLLPMQLMARALAFRAAARAK